jgi:hypothetical protein
MPVDVTLILENCSPNADSFIEWKVESDQNGEKTTGHLGETNSQTFTWWMGGSDQNIWFWWDTLDGETDATVLVDNTVVFKGHCANSGFGEKNIDDTCAHPIVYRGQNTTGPGPYLNEYHSEHTTHIHFT